MPAPWIHEVPAGVFVLRGLGERTTRVLESAGASYRGPDFGGIDYMPPNADGDAWVLVGDWTRCFEVQPAIRTFRDALAHAVTLANAGVTMERGGGARLEPAYAFADSPKGELRTWHAYQGGLAVAWWDQADLQARLASLPRAIGMHMGAPHWLGRGVSSDGGRLRGVTPYVRLDFDRGAGVRLSGLADPSDFEPWLDALRAATGWP